MNSADTPVTRAQLEALLAEVASLRAEVRHLRSEQVSPVASTSIVDGEAAVAAPVTTGSRRNFMRTAAVAAASAVGAAVVVGAQPAAATRGEMLFGDVNDAGGSSTRLVASTPNTAAFNVSNAGSNGVGVSSSSPIAYTAEAADTGLVANAGNTGGVFRGGNRGIDAASTGSSGSGVVASGQAYGLDASGQRAAIHLAISGGDPTLRFDQHAAGEIYHEDNASTSGRIWVCVRAGNPGLWREIASADSAGGLHPVLPRRVYDSRLADGPLIAGTNRIVSVRDGKNLVGVVEAVDLVPPGSSAVAYNLTIIDTVGSGFLAITPAGAATFAASAINWTSNGTAVANASIVTIDGARNVTVWAGGGGATQFVLDIVGYYR